jgi:hypothetical protein
MPSLTVQNTQPVCDIIGFNSNALAAGRDLVTIPSMTFKTTKAASSSLLVITTPVGLLSCSETDFTLTPPLEIEADGSVCFTDPALPYYHNARESKRLHYFASLNLSLILRTPHQLSLLQISYLVTLARKSRLV